MALLMENMEIMDLKDKFLQTEQRIIHYAGIARMRENLFAAGSELAFLISTAMKSQYSNCEAAVCHLALDPSFSIFSSAVCLILVLIMAKTKCN